MRRPEPGWRWIAVPGLAVFLCAGAMARAGSVRVQAIEDCTQRPRITVLRDGKPAAGIAVEVFRPVEHPNPRHYQNKIGRTLHTDAKGEVLLPKLPEAVIHVVARWSSGSVTTPDLHADLWVRSFPEDPEAEWHFTMDLGPYPNEQQYVEQTAHNFEQAERAAEGKPIAEQVQQFGGVVVDPSGAKVPHVSIEVARLHMGEKRPVRRLETDSQGHFWALLPAGDYVAIFEASGFQEDVQAVKIEPAAKAGEMRVLLHVGAATE